MIDLHTHTNESDGSLTPAELVDAARNAGLRAIAITDHDTFAGYDLAQRAGAGYDLAQRPGNHDGIDLIRGIEVSTRDGSKSIHVLGYFLDGDPAPEFQDWLTAMLSKRAERNRRLAARLRELGIAIEVEEVEALGRTVTGRVHFARVLMRKKYIRSIQEGFQRYLGETAPAYIEIDDPPSAEAIARLRAAGGLPVIAHTARYEMQDPARETTFLRRLTDAGLAGIEVIHTDHEAHDIARYDRLATELGLFRTGGSDFHGDVKPHVKLGYGNYGRTPIPPEWLDAMRAAR